MANVMKADSGQLLEEARLGVLGSLIWCVGEESMGSRFFPCGLEVSSWDGERGSLLGALHRRHHKRHPEHRGGWIILAHHASEVGEDGYYRVVETYWCDHEAGPAA